MYHALRFEAMRRNNGEAAHRITRERFWELLEVMWPRRWDRVDPNFEFFSMTELWCAGESGAGLYTFCVRYNDGAHDNYFEMISPGDASVSELRLKVQMVLDEEDRVHAGRWQ